MAGTPGAALQLLSIVSFQFPLFELIDLLGNLGIGNVMGRQTERHRLPEISNVGRRIVGETDIDKPADQLELTDVKLLQLLSGPCSHGTRS